MKRIYALAGIGAAMAWIGVAEILDRNFFLGCNTLAIVVICLLVALPPAPPSVQSDVLETPLPASDDLSTSASTGRGAEATNLHEAA